ncbi:MAG: hypothetical protein CMO81_11935 [Waddliaceae bacterium]|nr:hypothetical protein [Waddliaceae bacterium]
MRTLLLAFFPILFLTGCFQEENKNIHGYVEGEFVMIAATTSGTLESLLVRRGDSVKIGEKLFSLDLTALEAQKKSAQSEIKRLQAEVENAQREYDRILPLSQTGAASIAKLDDSKTRLSSLSSTFESAQQTLVQIEKKLEDSAPISLSNAKIQDTFYTEGEFIPEGKPVISLLPPENIKVRFFVSQEEFANLSLGQTIKIICDGFKTTIPARISYISPDAEYTPPVIYSVESREKFVFLIEAVPDKYHSSLHPGLPVSIDLGK